MVQHQNYDEVSLDPQTNLPFVRGMPNQIENSFSGPSNKTEQTVSAILECLGLNRQANPVSLHKRSKIAELVLSYQRKNNENSAKLRTKLIQIEENRMINKVEYDESMKHKEFLLESEIRALEAQLVANGDKKRDLQN